VMTLSAQLRGLVGIRVASVDPLTYEEFIRSVPNPTTIAVINMDPLKGSALLEIDPSITFTIIDKLFGGLGEATKMNRELTDIERSVMEELIEPILDNLRIAWSNVIDLKPKLDYIETNPKFAQISPPNEMVILITFETKVGEVEGMINLCVPYRTLEPIIDNLSANYYNGIKPGITEKKQLRSREDVPVKLIAEMFRRSFSIQEINDWKEDTVLLPLRPTAPNFCFLKLGDRHVWRCEILPDVKLFPKSVKILNFIEDPFEAERMENMENTNIVETPSTSVFQQNKAPIIGFILMLAGPAIIMIAGFLTDTFGYISEIAANIISWTAIALPGIGAVICIVMLFRWKKTGKLGRALSIVTVIMCNPFFYFIYLFMCGIASKTMAGLNWM